MSSNYSRLLRDEDLVEHFLVKVLQFDHNKGTPKVIRKIVTSEKMLMDFKEDENTLISTKHRDRNFKDDIPRWALRQLIINELFNLQRLGNDDDTSLGNGGALPASEIKE
jgi:hypothetical protein